ncbi:MAG: alpha-amylase family glycosyl hydrolase [Anaeromyxobacter sp.]
MNPFDQAHPANYACWSGNRSMPELDHANPAVQAYVLQVITHWLRRGVDGWRFDAPERLRDHAFWREVRRQAEAARPGAYLVGESWGDASPWLDGAQWHGTTHYPLLYALYRFAAGARLDPAGLLPSSGPQPPLDAAGFAAALEGLLRRDRWPTPLAHLTFLSTHDVGRFLTAAGGDRASLRLGALLLFTVPGVPCLWAGDEVGMTGGPPPASRGGFWPRERWDLELRDHHRALAALRRAHPALRRGGYRTLHASGGLLAFERAAEGERLVVLANAGDAAASAVVELGPEPALRFGQPALAAEGGGRWRVGLPARAGAVLRG